MSIGTSGLGLWRTGATFALATAALILGLQWTRRLFSRRTNARLLSAETSYSNFCTHLASIGRLTGGFLP